MNCLFCPNIKIINRDVTCENCKVRYYHFNNGSLSDYHFDIEYKGTMYTFNFYLRFFLVEVNDMFTISVKGKEIIYLRYIPNISPFNCLNKLPTLLTFL